MSKLLIFNGMGGGRTEGVRSASSGLYEDPVEGREGIEARLRGNGIKAYIGGKEQMASIFDSETVDKFEKCGLFLAVEIVADVCAVRAGHPRHVGKFKAWIQEDFLVNEKSFYP